MERACAANCVNATPSTTSLLNAVRCAAMSTWAGIVRVSHMGIRQAGADDFHADRDQTRLIEGAVPKDDELVILAPELNVSGGLPHEQRPSLLAAIEGIEAGVYVGIIVGYLSRLGRNVKEQLRTYDRVHAAGGRIIVAQEGIDARTRGGRLQRNILAAIHEDEREMHVERFDNLRRWACEAGIWKQRQTPLGYSRDDQTRRLVPDDHADDVRWAFRSRGAGGEILTIATRLGMTPSGVRALLRNPVYLGELRTGGRTQRDGTVSPLYVNESAHPALVTREEFEAVQHRAVRHPRSSRPAALLAGLARCASCGHLMTRRGASYGCVEHHSGARCPAPAFLSESNLDAYVTPIALAELQNVRTRAGQGDALQQSRERRAAAERELNSYLQAVSVLDVGAEAFAQGAAIRRHGVDEAIADERRHLAARPAAIPLGGTLANHWPDMDPHHRNALLRALLDTVVVKRAGGRGHTRVAIEDRVRVIRAGSGLEVPKRVRATPMGLHPIDFDDIADPAVLRVEVGQDPLAG